MAILVRSGLAILVFLTISACEMQAQDWENLQIHGYATQGFLFSSRNNYLTMKTSSGSLQWSDGAISVSDSVSDKLRVGMQLHMYQLGEFGGSRIQVDWASGDYKFNDYVGVRAGKIKTVIGLFNDSQDVEPVYLWALLPQGVYPIDNRGFMLSELGGEMYGEIGLGRSRGKLSYHAHLGESHLDENQGYSEQLKEVGLSFADPPQARCYGGDLRWATPIRGWTVGSSALVLKMDGTAPGAALSISPRFISAFYSQIVRGKWFFAGEYWRVPANPVLTIGPMTVYWPLDDRSWYAMASYRLSKKLQVGGYYSHYVNKGMDTRLPQSYSKDWVVSGRYDFNQYFYGKLEGHFLNGTGLGYYSLNNPSGVQRDARLLAAKIGFTF